MENSPGCCASMEQNIMSTDSEQRFAELSALTVERMRHYGVPGIALGIIDGDVMHVAGFGVTNVQHPLPVDPDTLFQIGSTSKTVTGTLVMRLVEQGLLDLDTPVQRYLPELRLSDPEVAAQVTLRHLFTHTAGWLGDFFPDTGPGDDALARAVAELADLPQLTPPGAVWSYNNAGFYLAGRLIELATGKSYEAAARELLLDPLGMAMSFFTADEAITYRVASGHRVPVSDPPGRPELLRAWALARAARPVGGIISTVRDQLRYARFHLGDGALADGTRLLSAATMERMRTPVTSAADGEQMALTWFVRDVGDVRIYRHGGATMGQLSAFQFVPAKGFAITILTNANRGGELNQELVAAALRIFLGVENQPPTVQELLAEQLAEYCGRYSAALQDIELRLERGELICSVIAKGGFPTPDTPPPPPLPDSRALSIGADRLMLLDPPFKDIRGEFLRDEQGRIVWLRIGGRIHRRNEN